MQLRGRRLRGACPGCLRAAGFAAPAIAAFGLLALFTWRRSGDFMIDFGRELYIPWRLSEGAVLYRDVDSLMGPAAAYINAVLFELAGPSLSTLLAANLVVAAIAAFLIYTFFDGVVRASTRLVLVLLFIVVSCFSHLAGHGNYSFITPYSHEATYGFVFALIALVSLTRWMDSGARRWSLICGLGLGLTSLTKPEIFVATAMACATGWVLHRWQEHPTRTDSPAGSLLFLGAVLSVPVLAAALFLIAMPARQATAAALGAWVNVDAVNAYGSGTYYRSVAGLDEPGAHFVRMLAYAAAGFALLALSVVSDRLLGTRLKHSGRARVLATAVLGVVAVVAIPYVPWFDVPRGFPALVLAGGAVAAFQAYRHGTEPAHRRRWVVLLAWAVFSLAMLAKIILAARISHYGFYQALPAMLFLAAMALDVIPALLEESAGGGMIVRRVAMVFTAIFATYYAAYSTSRYAARSLPLGTAAGSMLFWNADVSSDGELLQRLLDTIRTTLPAHATLAVLPEGAGINFLTRRRNPTSHISVMPPELSAYGEAEVVAEFRRSPPSYVVLWPRDLRDYGLGRFSQNTTYGAQIFAWLEADYVPIRKFVALEGSHSLYREFVLLAHYSRFPSPGTE